MNPHHPRQWRALPRRDAPPVPKASGRTQTHIASPFAQAEAEECRKRVLASEAEMRDLLRQVEKERETANRRLRQLGSVLGELQSGLLGSAS